MNIPHDNAATCLVKCKKGNCGAAHFNKVAASLLMQKGCPDHREGVSFCRPVFRVQTILIG